jgi:hypothetical protein
MNLQTSGSTRTCELREAQGVLVRGSRRAQIFMNKTLGVGERPSQRRHLKKSEFEVCTGGWLVNM